MTVTRRTRGMSAGLSREVIVAAAEAVAERSGFAGTSIRAVAAELDVTPTALYNHVSGKDELVDAVADLFVARLLAQELPTDPIARVRELVRRLRKAGIDHPGLLSSVAGHIPDQAPSAQLDFSEQLLDALVAAGATETQSHLLYELLVLTVVGSTIARTNFGAPGRRSMDERLADHIGHDGVPRTGRYLRSRNALVDDDRFEEELGFLLRDLTG